MHEPPVTCVLRTTIAECFQASHALLYLIVYWCEVQTGNHWFAHAQVENAGARVEAALEAAYQAVTEYSELHDPKASRPALVFDPVNSAVWIKLVKGSQVSYMLRLVLLLPLLLLCQCPVQSTVPPQPVTVW